MNRIAYSVPEIKKAGLSVRNLKQAKIPFDLRRKSSKEENIKKLKELFKDILKEQKAKTPKTKKKATSKKEKKGEEKIQEKEEKKELKVKSLEELDGITKGKLKKLNDLGIDTPEKLLEEDVRELSKLTRITQKQIRAWKAQILGEEN